MQTFNLDFVLERATKNTLRYAEQPALGEEEVVGVLYVKKSALKGKQPQTLKVTIEVPS